MSRHIAAARALLPRGWAANVRVELGGARIARIETGAAAEPGDTVVDALLPAVSNLHSHTFQRAMAGMTEYRSQSRDSFWTWRELMYRFLERLTPEHIEAIAAQAFMEMQERGFAAVAEFHYLHNQPGGRAYANPAELSERILAAASETGIGLAYLPVIYGFGGAGKKPLQGGQLRFGSTPDSIADLVARVSPKLRAEDSWGLAPHSLRAIDPSWLPRIKELAGGNPIHIHAAEQIKEVEDVEAWLGARPVEWLLANGADEGWCLIHATQMTDVETRALARSGAVAGLCPVTEANLGDGIFNAREFLDDGGLIGLGTDSNIRISLAQEICGLEYSQRLRHRERNVLDTLYPRAAAGGAKALRRDSGEIAPGKLADLVALDMRDWPLEGDRLIEAWVFAAHGNPVTDLWSAGRHCVKDGRHALRDRVARRYRETITGLVGAL